MRVREGSICHTVSTLAQLTSSLLPATQQCGQHLCFAAREQVCVNVKRRLESKPSPGLTQ